MGDQPPPRRRIQFRLRTLFIIVTVAALGCAWLGREYRVVQGRKAVLQWVEKHGGAWNATLSSPNLSVEEPFLIRRWLGDRAVAEFIFNAPLAADDERRIREAFPGAAVSYVVW